MHFLLNQVKFGVHSVHVHESKGGVIIWQQIGLSWLF